MRAEELDEGFDRGEDVTAMLDLSQARRPGHEQRSGSNGSLPDPAALDTRPLGGRRPPKRRRN